MRHISSRRAKWTGVKEAVYIVSTLIGNRPISQILAAIGYRNSSQIVKPFLEILNSDRLRVIKMMGSIFVQSTKKVRAKRLVLKEL